MNQDETTEILGTPHRPVSTRRRVISLIIAAFLAAGTAAVAIPRMDEDTSKVDTHAQPESKRKQLLRALGQETATRVDAENVSFGTAYACAAKSCPVGLDALNSALGHYKHVPAPGDSIAWYLENGTDFIFCVEHHTGSIPDAFALYASKAGVGGIVETDHGEGCMSSPEDYAAADAAVTSLTG